MHIYFFFLSLESSSDELCAEYSKEMEQNNRGVTPGSMFLEIFHFKHHNRAFALSQPTHPRFSPDAFVHRRTRVVPLSVPGADDTGSK